MTYWEIKDWHELEKVRRETALTIKSKIKKGESLLAIRQAGGELGNNIGKVRTLKKKFRDCLPSEFDKKFKLLLKKQKKSNLYNRTLKRLFQHFGSARFSPVSESMYFITPKGLLRFSRHRNRKWEGHQIVII